MVAVALILLLLVIPTICILWMRRELGSISEAKRVKAQIMHMILIVLVVNGGLIIGINIWG